MDAGGNAASGILRDAGIFIDGPNIAHWAGQYVDPDTLEWAPLIGKMLEILEPLYTLSFGGLYVFKKEWLGDGAPPPTLPLAMQLPAVHKLLNIYERNDKDVDSYIVADLYQFIVAAIARQYRLGLRSPYKVTVVLGSGDGVFGRAIGGVRKTFGDSLELILHSFYWEEKLAEDLRRQSDYLYPLERRLIPHVVVRRAS